MLCFKQFCNFGFINVWSTLTITSKLQAVGDVSCLVSFCKKGLNISSDALLMICLIKGDESASDVVEMFFIPIPFWRNYRHLRNDNFFGMIWLILIGLSSLLRGLILYRCLFYSVRNMDVFDHFIAFSYFITL